MSRAKHYFHTACGHRHRTAKAAGQCPARGFDMYRLAPYRVTEVWLPPLRGQLAHSRAVEEA